MWVSGSGEAPPEFLNAEAAGDWARPGSRRDRLGRMPGSRLSDSNLDRHGSPLEAGPSCGSGRGRPGSGAGPGVASGDSERGKHRGLDALLRAGRCGRRPCDRAGLWGSAEGQARDHRPDGRRVGERRLAAGKGPKRGGCRVRKGLAHRPQSQVSGPGPPQGGRSRAGCDRGRSIGSQPGCDPPGERAVTRPGAAGIRCKRHPASSRPAAAENLGVAAPALGSGLYPSVPTA